GAATALNSTSEPKHNASIGANYLDTKRSRFHNANVAQATAPQVFDNPEILDAEELALRLKVKVSWVIDHSSQAKTRDPLPVLRLGRLRRYRWGSREMNQWLDRRAGISTIAERKTGRITQLQ